ncbi:MAG: hypothetical protein PWP37_1216 [Thermotogota bacterium]|nr:hypothetical protein [Thermotogota bacterium]MDK2865024.1 hypothetical protein [Thermotogota bacterium]
MKLSVVGLMIFKNEVILVQRGSQVKRHKGEIALPGGAVEPAETELEALRREILEEIGVDIYGNNPIFFAETCTSNSRFRIRAYAIFFDKSPELKPDGFEVVKVHRVPLNEVMTAPVRWENLKGHRVPVIRFSTCTVWGATGRLLISFREWYSGGRIQIQAGKTIATESQRDGSAEGRFESKEGRDIEG